MKYRIKIETLASGRKRYLVQQRHWLIGWFGVGVTEDTLEDAQRSVQWNIKYDIKKKDRVVKTEIYKEGENG